MDNGGQRDVVYVHRVRYAPFRAPPFKIKIKQPYGCFSLVGRDGFEPSYSYENRFTVCRL